MYDKRQNIMCKMQLSTMINAIPDNDIHILLEVVKRFIPFDIDDIETPEDTAAHLQAMKEYEAGETIAFEDVNWN